MDGDRRYNLHEQCFLLLFFGIEYLHLLVCPPDPCQSASFFYKSFLCNEAPHHVFPIFCSKFCSMHMDDLVQKSGFFYMRVDDFSLKCSDLLVRFGSLPAWSKLFFFKVHFFEGPMFTSRM